MSIVPRADRKPHWLSGMMSCWPTWLVRRFSKTRASIFPATDSNEIPRWLSQQARSPLRLQMCTNWASLKSCGTQASVHMSSTSSTRWGRRWEPRCLKISTGIPSTPGDFPVDIWLTARCIFAAVGTSSRWDATGHCGTSSRTVSSNLLFILCLYYCYHLRFLLLLNWCVLSSFQ